MRRRIAVVTGTRADYGLLYWLLKEIESDEDLELLLIVTGSHLEAKYGFTKEVILDHGFKISAEINCSLISDRPVDIAKSIAQCLTGMSEAFTNLRPDIVVVLGDRFEILGVAQACLVLNIPLAHIHGGEATEGLIDDGIRHSITKMSHIHFCANSFYKRRIVQMGEDPSRVFDFGAPGLDNIVNLKLLSRKDLSDSLGINLAEKIVLVTYHPVTLDEFASNLEIENFINGLSTLSQDVQIIITLPNADTYSEYIRRAWEKFCKARRDCHVFISLGQLKYLSLMKESIVVAGNSSSGIVEAPFMGKQVVDVGIRQKGRLSSDDHVLRVKSDAESVAIALEKCLSKAFLHKPSTLYGDGHTSRKIKNQLKAVNLKNILYKKFFDLGEI